MVYGVQELGYVLVQDRSEAVDATDAIESRFFLLFSFFETRRKWRRKFVCLLDCLCR